MIPYITLDYNIATGVWLVCECTLAESNYRLKVMLLGITIIGLLNELGYIRNWEAQNTTINIPTKNDHHKNCLYVLSYLLKTDCSNSTSQ